MAPPFLVPQAVSMVTFARVARARGGDESAAIRESTRIVAAAAGAIALGGTVFAQPVLGAVLGDGFTSMRNSFVVLLIGIAPTLAGMPGGAAIAAEGGILLKAWLALLGVGIAVAGTIVLAPAHGAPAAALAVAGASAISGLASLWFVRARYGLRLRDVQEGLGLMVLALVVAWQMYGH
jgi:O-antigen/teichoic acid export membrane protein